MPNIPAHVVWRRLRKHTDVNVTKWNASAARRSSKHGHAQYNPLVYHTDDAIRDLESRCIRDGVVVTETANFTSCYLILPDTEPYIGVCSGEYTHIVWAELCGGTFHGYPIHIELLRSRLRKRGLQLP
jgi:hypothetical protein